MIPRRRKEIWQRYNIAGYSWSVAGGGGGVFALALIQEVDFEDGLNLDYCLVLLTLNTRFSVPIYASLQVLNVLRPGRTLLARTLSL